MREFCKKIKREMASGLMVLMLFDCVSMTAYGAEPGQFVTSGEAEMTGNPEEETAQGPVITDVCEAETGDPAGSADGEDAEDPAGSEDEEEAEAGDQTGSEDEAGYTVEAEDQTVYADETEAEEEEQGSSAEDIKAETEEQIEAEEDIVRSGGTQTMSDVMYIDGSGVEKTCETAVILSESETELAPGWYVVSTEIDYDTSVILNGNGEYHIILADGGKMSIGTNEFDGIDEGAGLGCSYDNAAQNGIKLNIYAQSTGDDAGQLKVYSSSATPDGRPEDKKVGDAINVGELAIFGGKITCCAVGGSRSYGINTDKLTINGGSVDANGNLHAVNCTGTIVMNGGSLNALAETNERTCAINCAGDITIYGGTIIAEASEKNGHGINSTGDITINGGTVIADAGNEFKTDEVSGGCGLSAGGNITISGNVTANAYGRDCHGISSAGNIIIKDGNVTATTKGEFGHALYSPHNITIDGGTIEAHTYDENANAIFCDHTGCLTVNGGSIRAVTEEDSASGIKADSITINDGEVYAEAKNTEEPHDNFGIRSGGRITINGGRVTAKGTNGGLHSQYSGDDGSAILLSWKNETDFVNANSVFLNTNQNVAIEPGKTFVDADGLYYVAANASEVKGLTDFKLTATSDTVYAVYFDCGGYGTVPPLQILKEGSKVTEPDGPKEGTKYNGLDFAGWYQDEAYQIRYDFDSKVTADLYLYAKWATKSTNLEDASVKMIYRHTGGNIDPVVENNIGETLTKDTDYTVSCKKEGSDTSVSMKDPGFYSLTVNGKGSYTGSKTVRVCVLTFDAYDPVSGELKHGVTLPEGKDAAIVTASTVSMNTGWYVVTESVNVNSRMKVNGDVHLVICDGVTLNAGGDAGNRGISVAEGNSLTIYSQEGNSGKLDASTSKVNYYAAIGGDCPANYSNNHNNNINNNNGDFSFLNGKENGNAGSITIHGGEIIAKGSMYSAAIGKAGKDGVDGKGGKITIYGGKITAERFTSYGDISSQSDTAIGGPGAEIHLSHCREDDYILSEGYQGTLNFDRAFIIEDTSTLVMPENINDSLGKKILPVDSFNVCKVTFDSNGGTPVKAQTLAMGKLATMPATPIKRGYRFVGWYTDRSFEEQFKFVFTSRPVDIDLILYAKWVEVGPISYIGAHGQISGFKAYSLMQEDYTELPAGSYYVDQTITLPDRVKVTGEVNLILGDGYTLTVPWGISVMGDNTLNIFCQSGGTGRLIANAASENAAIGGDSTGDNPSGSSGNINIYGGYIDAQGGTDAASIGGGKNNQNYGTIRIYGGTINSLSGKYAAAIGGGQISATKNAEKVTDGTIEIYGGTVTVSANAEGTGIGGGKHSYGGDIRILGGKVTVTVSPNNAQNDPYSGIGDGYLYKGPEKARITLGCRNADDFIYAEQYYGNVRVAPYQTLQLVGDDSTKFYGEISDPNGKIRKKTLKLSHTHELTFSVNGSTITASCSDPGCELHNNPAVLTLHAPSEQDIVYDSNEWPAIVTDDQGISGYAPVYYQKKSGNSWGEKVTSSPEAVGTYQASITLSDGKTHSTATVSVEYTIIKREVTISGLTADDKVYDDSTAAKINDTAIKLENMADGDDVHIVSGNASFDSADAGTSKTVTFRGYYLSGAEAGNYNLLSQPASVTADIEKRPVNIKADDQTIQIGEAIEEMAASCEQGTDKGICSGHVLKALTLTPDPDPRFVFKPAENGTTTADGAVIKRGDTDVTGNYEISYQPGSLEITLHRASVTKLPAAGVDLKYQGFEKEQWLLVYPGEADTKMEYKVQQISKGNGELLVNGDGSLVLNNEAPTDGYGDAFSAWEAGSYHVWYRAASANDLLPGEPGCISVNIATAPLTIRVPDASISYGDEFPALTPIVNGFVTPEEHQHIGTVKLEYLSDGEWKNAKEAAIQRTYPEPGTYPLTVSYNGDGEVTSCYTVTSVSGNLTVEPRTVCLNWGETRLTYNGKPQVPTVTLSNLAKNEDPAAVTVCMAGQQVNANAEVDYTLVTGEPYIATAAALSGNKAANYRLPADNTMAFSIAKAGYPWNIPTIKIEVPVSANTFTLSVAGKLSADAGKLTYPGIRTLSTNGFEHIEGGIAVNVDENGLATVSINRDIQNNITAGKSISFRVNVDSTNYDTRTVDVDAFFVGKYDAGVRITSGNAISINYDQVPGLTLGAVTTCENAGSNGTWTWESSHPEVAAVQGGNQRDDGNCNFIIKSVGTSRISVKYESSTATGYADLILTVNPVYVSVPEVTKELNYTGSHQMCMGNYDNKIFSVSGASASMPGEYVVTIALNDTDKYRWEDGTSDEKSISWRINKMNGPAAPTGLTGIAPTTGDNIDGKISGVKNTMEYSTNENF
ncbi:MAG: InlB B-repeat-containing protein, partial [Lachnospiraceae bacterium]|nr:InlB B-repeat-containing protein [Lachnospiraceae bacterium]